MSEYTFIIIKSVFSYDLILDWQKKYKSTDWQLLGRAHIRNLYSQNYD